MTGFRRLALMIGILGLFACSDEKAAEAPPPPATMTASAIGHYCGMNVMEHTGPKGQIILAGQDAPVWFSSARDTLAFTMLPEEPKDIRAIYVSDMSKAPTWDKPGETNWVDAKKAVYVIGSSMQGGMGGAEAVPFSDEAAATGFIARNGGRLAHFTEIPKDYVLGSAAGSGGHPAEHGGAHLGEADTEAPPATQPQKDGHAH